MNHSEHEVYTRSLLRSLLPVRDLCEIVVEYAHEFQGVRCDFLNHEGRRAKAWLMEGPLPVRGISLLVADFLKRPEPRLHPAHSFTGDLCIMPCGRIASGAHTSLVAVWDSADLWWLPLNSNKVNVMTAFPDGRTLTVGYADGCVCAVDMTSHGVSFIKVIDEPPVFMTALSNDTLAVGSVYSSVYVFDIARKTCLSSYRPLTSRHALRAMIKFGDGFATGDGLGSMRVWSAQGECLRLIHHSSSVEALTVTHDGALAVAFRDRVVVNHSNERITRLEGHASYVLCLGNVDANRLASGDLKGVTRVWHVPSGACLFELVADSPVRGLAVLPGGLLASRSSDGLVRVWDERGELRRVIKAHDGAITHFCVSPTGLLVTGGVDHKLRMWM